MLGTWVTPLDYGILSFMEEHRLVLTPKAVFLNADTDAIYNSHKRRMSTLLDAGLLEQPEDRNGWYRITEVGIKAINGEVSRETVMDLDPSS